MGVLSHASKYQRDVERFSLNTGTNFDLATGSFLPGKDGHMILNGGVAMVNAVVGRAQTYKSSVALGYFTKVLRNYKNSEGICYDSEMSLQGKKRLVNLSGQVADPELESRMDYYEKSDFGMEELFSLVRDIANDKDKNKKDYIRETPFIDATGKCVRAWIPTVIAIDSWSFMSSSKESTTYSEHDLGDSKTNTAAMLDGKLKSDFMRQLPSMCGSKGIYFILTAHIGDNISMNPYAPIIKDVPSMSASDRLKNVGSQFKFLATNMIQTRKASVLQDSNKKCLYPTEYSSDVELQEVSSIVCRCKNNVSGAQVDHISSQFYGLQESLEYYHLIKETKSDLLIGTTKQKLSITDHEFSRHNIRQLISDDYEFRRALEILGQFCYIRNRWNLPNIKKIGYVELTKKFVESSELKSKILNSTGIWSYCDQKPDREYLSILDIIELINKK